MKPLMLVLLSLVSNSALSAKQHDAVDIFNQMKAFVGVWKKEASKNSTFSVTFELLANDTTLVETWYAKDKKHSLTLYHLDGDNIIATHYCPKGNQPRLQLTDDATLLQPRFALRDITNLDSPDTPHQNFLAFDIASTQDRLVRKERYITSSQENPSELILVRQSPTPGL